MFNRRPPDHLCLLSDQRYPARRVRGFDGHARIETQAEQQVVGSAQVTLIHCRYGLVALSCINLNPEQL